MSILQHSGGHPLKAFAVPPGMATQAQKSFGMDPRWSGCGEVRDLPRPTGLQLGAEAYEAADTLAMGGEDSRTQGFGLPFARVVPRSPSVSKQVAKDVARLLARS